MGLSSSQARLLNLTRRMHDIEYKAQNLEAQKLQMANESKQVYTEYENALNRQKVQFKNIGADGSANYVDASINTLLQAGYKIKILSGGNWYDYIGTDIANKTVDDFQAFDSTAKKVTLDAEATADMKSGDLVVVGGKNYKLSAPIAAGAETAMAYSPKENKTIEQTPLTTIDFTSTEVLRNMVEAGFIVFEKPLRDGTSSEVNIATDTSLQEVADEVELKKAEAKYEADMRKIDAKDKKFDSDLAAMEQERNAIKTEMETLKTVAKDNVERTFKLFS